MLEKFKTQWEWYFKRHLLLWGRYFTTLVLLLEYLQAVVVQIVYRQISLNLSSSYVFMYSSCFFFCFFLPLTVCEPSL